jgi:hypothetical protein|tara:strand:+ start:5781 stop:6503 length:723 start_codon:yes stop_codon:yes gene_type:complete
LVKYTNIKDIPWYNFTLLRSSHSDKDRGWNGITFAKRMYIDNENNLLYTLSSETTFLQKVAESNIVERMSYGGLTEARSYCVESFITNNNEVVGYVQKMYGGVDTTIFNLLIDSKYSRLAVDFINRWKRAVNKCDFFWDLSEVRIDSDGNIQPIDLDEGILSSDRGEWPWWTQFKGYWTEPMQFQETLARSGIFLGPKFDYETYKQTQSHRFQDKFAGYLIPIPKYNWKNYLIEMKKNKK